MTLTPYQKIKRAAEAGRGVKLTATECWQLMQDDAIAQVAEQDEAAWAAKPKAPARGVMACAFCGAVEPIPHKLDCARPRGVLAVGPVAWMHEYTDPHTGQRAREVRRNKPSDAELLPGDTLRPLAYADGVEIPLKEKDRG